MNVGDYVRTTNQGIKRIDKIFENATVNKYGYEDKKNDYEYFIIRTDEIIKSSPNIIDLIEVGDYVNGSRVYTGVEVDTDDYGNDFKQIYVESDKHIYHSISEEDIKSIVTKEQFESMEYKVGE